jgi:hypothetical protein
LSQSIQAFLYQKSSRLKNNLSQRKTSSLFNDQTYLNNCLEIFNN